MFPLKGVTPVDSLGPSSPKFDGEVDAMDGVFEIVVVPVGFEADIFDAVALIAVVRETTVTLLLGAAWISVFVWSSPVILRKLADGDMLGVG